MGLPVVTGDIGGPYTFPSVPPLTASFPMTVGSTNTFISGKSVMLVGAAQTGAGAIISSTLFTTKSFIEGKPVHLVGSITNLSTGWLGGVLQGGGATNTLIN